MSPTSTDSRNQAETRWFYVDANNSAVGPVCFGEIRRLLLKGQITPKTFVMPEGGAEWVPLSKARQTYKAYFPRFDWRSKPGVLLLLILFPPLGLVRLWQSPKFGSVGRICLTAPTLLLTLPIFLIIPISIVMEAGGNHRATASPPPSEKRTVKALAPKDPRPSGQNSIAYKIASLDAGHLITEDAPAVTEFDILLSDIARTKDLPKEDVANFTWAVKKRLSADGVEVTAMELLKGAHKIVMDPQAMAAAGNPTYESLLSKLAALIFAKEQKKR